LLQAEAVVGCQGKSDEKKGLAGRLMWIWQVVERTQAENF
jgi:hypothetical protein